MSESYNLFYFFKQFPDEESCRRYLEKRRWNNAPVCPHCGNSLKIYRHYCPLKIQDNSLKIL